MTYEIIQGDCLAVMPTLADASCDAIICDLPYGVTACKWDSVIPFAPMWEQLKRIAKPRAAIVLFASQPFTSALVMSNPTWFRYEWVWRKTRASNFATAKAQPLRVCESILVFGVIAPHYFPQMTEGASYRTRTQVDRSLTTFGAFKGNNYNPNEVRAQRYPLNVLDMQSMRQQDRDHPTQKPVALMEYLIRTYTNERDTVLDFCAGSGSTGVGCVNTDRNFIGIEREADYATIARRRLADATASQQPALFAAD